MRSQASRRPLWRLFLLTLKKVVNIACYPYLARTSQPPLPSPGVVPAVACPVSCSAPAAQVIRPTLVTALPLGSLLPPLSCSWALNCLTSPLHTRQGEPSDLLQGLNQNILTSHYCFPPVGLLNIMFYVGNNFLFLDIFVGAKFFEGGCFEKLSEEDATSRF